MDEPKVKKLTISIVPLEQMKDFSIRTFHENGAAIDAGGQVTARRVFATEELFWETITPRRLAILKAIGGRGPVSIREAARLVDRDVKAVHGDVQKMLQKRLIEKTDNGKIESPYEEIHFDFTVRSDTKAA